MNTTTTARPGSTPPAPGPVAYQHRAHLFCPACFAVAPFAPAPDGASVVPVPPRPPVTARACAACGVALPMPGLFGLGVIAATPGALALCEAGLVSPARLLTRHWAGDWGDIDPADYGLNEDALRDGARLLSTYHLAGGARVWIITEADRHVTTLLTPDEY